MGTKNRHVRVGSTSATADTLEARMLASVHESAKDLHDVGIIDKQTMREFDEACVPEVPKLTKSAIVQIRREAKMSQPVFAIHLNVTKSTVQQWESGDKTPRGPAAKLLDLVRRHGMDYIQ